MRRPMVRIRAIYNELRVFRPPGQGAGKSHAILLFAGFCVGVALSGNPSGY